MNFNLYTKTSAPEASQPLLAQTEQSFGFVPNLHGVMAEAPALLEAYNRVWALVGETTLTPIEQHVVMQTANYENNCHYCVPGHTYLMGAIGASQDVIEALREGQPIADTKLETLRSFTREMIETRGHASEETLEAMVNAGYNRRQILEVIVGLAAKTLSNYTNAIAHTPIDAPVQRFAWTHPNERLVASR
jgi:alkylhydroperoxidase family enzyme